MVRACVLARALCRWWGRTLWEAGGGLVEWPSGTRVKGRVEAWSKIANDPVEVEAGSEAAIHLRLLGQ